MREDVKNLDKMRKTLARKVAIFQAMNMTSTKSLEELMIESEDFSTEEFDFLFNQKTNALIELSETQHLSCVLA